MAGALKGNWKLVESNHFNDFTTAMGLADEHKDRYKAMNAMGDGGLELVINAENKVVTTDYKLKGEVKHSESFTIGESCEVKGIMGNTRTITASVDGETVVCHAKTEKAEVENRIGKEGDQLVMTMTCAGVSAVMKFNPV